MKRPTVFQLSLLKQFPLNGDYVRSYSILRPDGHRATNQHMCLLCQKRYIVEHPTLGWRFRLTDEAIEYLNGVKIK